MMHLKDYHTEERKPFFSDALEVKAGPLDRKKGFR